MEKNSKIYVAGHSGLIGSAILRRLETDGFTRIVTRTRAELDLTDQAQVRTFFESERPEYVFFAAARVGGISANNTYRAEFIYENVAMQNNVLHSAFMNEVKKLIFFASADVYPRDCPQPAKEEYLLDGKLEFTCEPFAVAKIAGLKMCESYNIQYGTDFIALIPPNVYGPNQHYDIMNAQVLPSLIKKFHEAKTSGRDKLTIWGSGAPVRDFLYVDDVADATLFLMDEYAGNEVFNIGTGGGYTIRELAELIREEVGYGGEIAFDTARPDGVSKKLLDTVRINSLGWRHSTGLRQGVRQTYRAFLDEIQKSRVRVSTVLRVNSTEKYTRLIDAVSSRWGIEPQQPESYKNRVVMKPWGYEFLMFENGCVAVWFLFIKKGHSTSMHCHPNKKTSLIILDGKAMSNTFPNRRYLKSGEALVIEKGVFHSTKALSENGLSLFEIETPPMKTDLMRLEDRYGRERTGYEGISDMETRRLDDFDYFCFEEPEVHEKIAHDNGKFAVSLEAFTDEKEFEKFFTADDADLYTLCRGKILDRRGAVLLDTGETQNSDIFTNAHELKVSGKTTLLKISLKEMK